MLYIGLGVGAVVLLGLVGAFVWWWRSTEDDPRQVADEKVPVRRFAQGVMFLLTRSEDYGYFPPEPPQKTLGESWDIDDGQAALSTVRGLLDTAATGRVEVAFDLVRAVHVARMAAGALYMTQENSWALVAEACHKLQATFSSFEEIGKAYEQAAAAWIAGQGQTYDGTIADNMTYLAEFIWSEIDFRAPLTG